MKFHLEILLNVVKNPYGAYKIKCYCRGYNFDFLEMK